MVTETYNGFYVNIDYGALTTDERIDNGMKIAQNLYDFGWTENAIAGLLGNAQAESTMNPACIESSSSHARPPEWITIPDNQTILNSNYTGGCGITQWTPGKTKIVQWAEDTGRIWYDGMTQIFRIKWESENGYQMTLSQWDYFIHSEDPADDLAEYFLRWYENPSPEQYEQSVENRRRLGLMWYNRIHNKLVNTVFLFYTKRNNERKELKPPCRRI